MKAVVVGLGSIGTRHLTNLLKMGIDVCAVDIEPSKLASLPSSINGYSLLEEALDRESPMVAFICTLSNHHIEPAIACAARGCHLFIEKPLSMNLDGVDQLIDIVEKKKLINMVGCNMRFHPAIVMINSILSENPFFKKKMWANLEVGYFLPFSKPDYARSYQANKDMGGDLIFDCIHELDYAGSFFGSANKVFCTKGKLSAMNIDTDDFADILIEYKSGLACNVHMDYLQHGYARRCKIVAEDGTLVWDFSLQKVGVIDVESKAWHWCSLDAEINFNQMYVDEVRYFLDSVSASQATLNTIADSVAIIKLVLAANRSAFSGAWEELEALK